MSQPHPSPQFLFSPRQTQHIPQRPDLQTIKVLVHGILHECLELQYTLFNLQPRLWKAIIPIVILLRDLGLGSVAVCETEERGVGGEQACLEGVGAAVEYFVDGVYNVVNQRLEVEESVLLLRGVCVFGGEVEGAQRPLVEVRRTIGGQVKCSVRSMFSCCFALAILSIVLVLLYDLSRV